MTLYEFLYTGIGQFVAAYAPHEIFAALVNPLLIGGGCLIRARIEAKSSCVS